MSEIAIQLLVALVLSLVTLNAKAGLDIDHPIVKHEKYFASTEGRQLLALKSGNSNSIINFDDLPFNQSIKVVKGDGSKKKWQSFMRLTVLTANSLKSMNCLRLKM